MLIATVLNSDASVNVFEEISSLSFIPGSEEVLVIRLKQPQRKDKLRYVADIGATLTVSLPKKDGSTQVVTCYAFVSDRSMWWCDLPSSLTDNLVGGNFTFTLTEGTSVTSGYVESGLSLVITGGC